MQLIDLAWWRLRWLPRWWWRWLVCTLLARLDIGKTLLVAALRTVVQLSLIGLVLEALFSVAALPWIALMALVMLLMAGREVTARQKRRFGGGWAFGTVRCRCSFRPSRHGAHADRHHRPRALVCPAVRHPAAGHDARQHHDRYRWVSTGRPTRVAAARPHREPLDFGQRWQVTIGDARRDAMRSGMIPIITAWPRPVSSACRA